MSNSLKFNKEAVLSLVRSAAVFGLVDTGQDIADSAKDTVTEVSGDLKKSIKPQKLLGAEGGNLIVLEVGSDHADIGYAAIQELGPVTARKYKWKPYLRPALDKHGPELADNIKKKLGGQS